MGVTTTVIVWASVAKIEEAISATGKLEPQGTVKEVQAPVGGVVKAIYVDDGLEQARVQLRLPEELISLTKSRAALAAENQLYRVQLSGIAQGVHCST